MRVLVVNPGSSSVQLGVVEDGVAMATVPVDSPSLDCARGPLTELAGRYAPVDAVGVRFVHGGDRAAPELVTTAELARLAISPPDATPRVLVVAAREDLEIARQTTDVLRGRTS